MGLLSWLRGGRGADRPAGAQEATPASPSRADRFDVVELPPIQRTLTAPTLVTDPSAFERGLPTRQPTALSTPLGHLVSAEAPSGVVEGVTTPVQRSVVRFPVRAGGNPPAVAAEPAAPVPVRPQVQREGSARIPGRVPSSPGREASGQATSPAIQRSYEPPAGKADSATSAPAELPAGAYDGPAPVDAEGALTTEATTGSSVRPLVGEQPLLDSPRPESTPDADHGAAPVPGSGTGPGTSPGTLSPVQRSLPPTGTPEPPAPAPRRTPGLGAPLPALPPTAQRGAVHTSSPAAAPPPTAPAPFPVPAESAPSPLPTPAPAPESAPVPELVAPLLADRPLVLRTVSAAPAPAPDRAPVSNAPGAGAPHRAPVPAPPVVPVRWETPSPAVQRRTPASRAATTLQRASAPGSAARPAAPSAPFSPITSPPPRDAGDVAVAAGVAQRMADGSVVFAPPAPVRRPGPGRPASPAPFVQREVAVEEPPSPPPEDIPTAAAPDPAPDPPPQAPSEASSEGLSDPGAAALQSASGATAPGTPPVTDEFVRALYPSLARLLKAELRLERERAGRLIDTRF